MGCVSSKIVSRSLSFQEELLSQRIQRKADRNAGSGSAADEFQSGNFTAEPDMFKRAALDVLRNETSNTSELTASLPQEEEKQMQPASALLAKATEFIDADLVKQSISCRWFQEHEVSSLALERATEIKEERSKLSNGSQIRAWNFHTVEEYDALIERIRLSKGDQLEFDGKDYGSLQLHHSKSCLSEHAEQAIKQSPMEDESQVEENAVIEDKCILFSSRTQSTEVIQSPNSSMTTGGSNVVEDAAQNFKKGFRRKAMADELESLQIPTTIEFSGVASLREWLHVGGQVYSPGAYVTPKFGNYILPISRSENKCIDCDIFDPELVASFEKRMEQLEVEEESIIKQIEENFQGESTKEKQDQEEISSGTNDQL